MRNPFKHYLRSFSKLFVFAYKKNHLSHTTLTRIINISRRFRTTDNIAQSALHIVYDVVLRNYFLIIFLFREI